MFEEYRLRQASLTMEKEEICDLLSSEGLSYEEDIETAFGIFDPEERLLGVGCAAGRILKCFALREELRGKNLLSGLLSRLVENRFSKGFYDLIVITRKKNEPLFQGAGFYTVAATETLVLLENRKNGPERYLKSLRISPETTRGRVGAIVMNANPFTKGHRYLAERAAAACDHVHIFLVEEDRSLFSTADRLRLVTEGLADLTNVEVHLSGTYMISSSTFPSYFLKEDEDLAGLQAELDAAVFAARIAPSLNITVRYVGEEPLDPVTRRYNEALKQYLPPKGIEVIEIPRLTAEGSVISASRVRECLGKNGSPEALSDLLPEVTKNYLKTIQKQPSA